MKTRAIVILALALLSVAIAIHQSFENPRRLARSIEDNPEPFSSRH